MALTMTTRTEISWTSIPTAMVTPPAKTPARVEVESGQDPEAIELAQTIIDTQEAEIETMEDLLGSM